MESTSPNGKNKIEIVEHGHGFLTADEVKITFLEEGKIVKETKVDTAYNLQTHQPNHYKIKWTDNNKVDITARYESRTVVLNFNFSKGKLEIESKREANG